MVPPLGGDVGEVDRGGVQVLRRDIPLCPFEYFPPRGDHCTFLQRNGRNPLEDYSFVGDLLLTWRSTSAWIKAVILITVPGYIGVLAWLMLNHRAKMRRLPEPIDEIELQIRVKEHIRCILANWESKRGAQEPKTPKR